MMKEGRRPSPSLRLKLLGLTAAAVVLALGTAALLISLQTRRAFHRFVAEGDAAEARRLGDIVTFVYREGGGLPAALPLVRHLDEAQGLRLELRVGSPAGLTGHLPAPAPLQGAAPLAPLAPLQGAAPLGPLQGAAPLPTALATALAAAAAGQLAGEDLEQLLPPGAVLEIAPAVVTPMADDGAPRRSWGWSSARVVTQTRELAIGPADRISVPAAFAGPSAPYLLQPEAGFLGSFRHALLGAAFLAGGLALALGAGMARRLLSPVEALTQAARRLAAGDLGQRVAVRSGDEIGQLGQAFNLMASSLEQQEALRRRLVADVAHELRTPLSNLSGYLEALRDGVLQATPEQLASLHEEAGLLGRLVDDLQALAQAEAGEQRLSLRPTAVEPLLRQSLDAFRAQAAAKEQRLEADLAEGLGSGSLDPDRVAQILRNLLANALTHAPAGGRVTLEAARERDSAGDWLRLAVVDDGPGIPLEDQDKIFERFYRVDPSRSRDTGGSGLGLTIARQLAAAHGGSLTVDSRPGQGARFTLLLPFVPGAGSG